MPQTCGQCQSEAPDDAAACPSCGASLGSTATATATATQPPPAAPAPAAPAGSRAAASSASSLPAFKFGAARWTLADRIVGVATIVYFISLFLSWYTYSVAGFSFTADGLWHGWMYLSLILCIAIVAYLVLRAGWGELPTGTKIPHLTVMMAATIVNLVLVVIAFLDKPGGRWRRLGIRCVRRAHRRGRGCGALPPCPNFGRRTEASRTSPSAAHVAASSRPGMRPADGSASNATKRRITS